MKNPANEPLTFQPLGLAAEKLVGRLERSENHEKESQRNAGRSDTEKNDAERERENIDRELEQIRARVQWLNWLEFCLNKVTRMTSRQVGRG